MPRKLTEMTELELAEWAKDTCLLFGTMPETAFAIAGMFVQGIREHRERCIASYRRRRNHAQEARCI